MTTAKADAVVLRLVDHGERNRIVTLFTPEHGRVAAMARSARGKSRRFGGHLDLFHRGDAMLAHSRRQGGMSTLTGFEVRATYEAIRNDVTRFATASFFVELVLYATAAGDASPRQFELLTQALHGLATSETSGRRDLVLAFQLRWFELSGVLPPLDPAELANAHLPVLADQPLAIARALLSGVEIPDLDAARFQAVGALTRAVRRGVLGKPMKTTRFLAQALD